MTHSTTFAARPRAKQSLPLAARCTLNSTNRFRVPCTRRLLEPPVSRLLELHLFNLNRLARLICTACVAAHCETADIAEQFIKITATNPRLIL